MSSIGTGVSVIYCSLKEIYLLINYYFLLFSIIVLLTEKIENKYVFTYPTHLMYANRLKFHFGYLTITRL